MKLKVKIQPVDGDDGRVTVEFDNEELAELLRFVVSSGSGRVLYVADVAKRLGKTDRHIKNWPKSDKRGPIPFSYDDDDRAFIFEHAFVDWLTGACIRRRDRERVMQLFGARP